MSYDYIFILKKIDNYTWHIISQTGITMFKILNCASKNEAEQKALSLISSWRSSTLRIEE